MKTLSMQKAAGLVSSSLFLACIFIAAPAHVHAAQIIWTGDFRGSGSQAVRNLEALDAWTDYDMFGNPISYEGGYIYGDRFTGGYTFGDGWGRISLVDLDGYNNHYTNPDSQTFGTSNATGWNTHASQVSANRACSLVRPGSTATILSTSSYNSPDDNKLVRWNQFGTNQWQKANANDVGNSFIRDLSCSTNELPANALSASPTSIQSGESSTLTFDSGPYAFEESTICTPTNFSIPTVKLYMHSVVWEQGITYEGSPSAGYYTYLPADVGRIPALSGSVVVSPTVTTTYSYSCTNGNGTTLRTATVTVGTPPPPVPTATLSRSPGTIAAGGSSTLTWSSTNATSCTSGNFATGGLTSGSVSVSPSVTTTYSVTCTGAGGTSPVNNATVTVTGTTDLVAGPVTPTTAVAGASATLSSTISNNGTAATGAGFTNLFQRATDASGTGSTDIGTHASGALAASATGAATLTHTFPSAGTWFVRVCADRNAAAGTGTITESNEANNCTAWTAVTVSPAPGPNLTTGAVTPTAATVGTPVTLSATITNGGAVTTGTTFTNNFQRATDASGTGAISIGTATNSTLTAGASSATTLSYTFPSVATWYVRVCADNNASMVGTITETSEVDNCGAWTAVTATGPTAPNLTAGVITPTTATVGTAVTLSSTITNIGTASTQSTFTDLFQIANDASGTGATVIGTTINVGKTVGQSGPSTLSYTFTSGGTKFVRACADNNASMVGSIPESNESDNCSAWTAITITVPATPNLTAGVITPTTATVGTAVTLSSTVTNSGTASTGATFTNNFQRATDASGTGATSIGTAANSTLTAGASSAATLSYTFPSAATWFVRACADNNASMVGTITESNESDNCGAWTAVTVASAPAGADLTAGAVTPIDAYSLTATNLSAQITNQGTVSTGVGFTNVFQSATDITGTGATSIGTVANVARAGGTANTATLSYTFNSTGLKYVRVCADNNASMVGAITESNELNNCGAWTEISVTSPLTSGWIGQGCGDITRSYNGSCNKWAEPLDITCPAGQRLDVQDISCPAGVNNNSFKTAARCVVDAACSAPPPSAACVINTTVGVNVPATIMVQRGSNQMVQVGINWGDASAFVTSGDFTSGSCYPAWNLGCNGSYDTNLLGGSYGNQHIYTVPGTYEMVAYTQNGLNGGEVISLNGTWGDSSVSCTVNVAGPNLITGAITPTTATIGTPVSLSATVTNNGTVQTGSSFSTFTDVYQSATDAAGTGATVIGTASHSRLIAGASSASTLSYTFATAGTVFVRACADNNASFVGTVAETSELDNCGPWTQVTVTGPNLTAGIVTPTAAVAGTPVTFSSTITNAGTVSTGVAFTDLFQVANDASGTGATDIGTFANPIRTPGTSNAATLSYTFVTPGTKYVRVCADKSSAANMGAISETNESDNCSAWRAVTVTSPTSGPNLTSGAPTPTTATAGVAVTISATVTNNGTGSTGVGFTNLFQFDADADHSAVTSTQTDTSPVTAAGNSDVTSVSRTFPTGGTWYVRVCADNNASFVGSIIEMSENDNCSAWTSVNVSAATGANLVVGAVSPNSAIAGTPVTVSVPVTNNGTVSTGAGFTNLFQFDNNVDHTSVTTSLTDASAALGSGLTDTSSVSMNFPTAGTWYVRACADNNVSFVGSITESNEADNCGAWTAVSVGAVGANANLTTGTVTPVAAVAGTAVNLSAVVTNGGAVSTTYGFTNLFQIDADADPSTITSTQTDTSPVLASGATDATAVSYTFPSVGTWYVRVCADNNVSFVGVVTETNESDNCGAWTAVTVTASAGVNLTAGAITPITATAGTPVSLVSSITNAGSASTVTTFTDVFQTATDASGTGAVAIGTFTNPIRTAGSSGNATLSYTFPVAGTFYVRACADNNAAFVGTITESNEADNCGAWTAVSVGSTGAGVDLTAGAVTPSTATAGASVTISSTITNSGAASTGTGFTTLFQFDNDTDRTVITSTRTDAVSTLAPSGSEVSSVTYSYPTVGTWYVRACTDNNESFVGVITESNEGNNCSAWRTVSVTASTGAGVTSCTVSPGSVATGTPVTWTASPAGLGTYTWAPSEGGAPGGTGATLGRTYNSAGTYGMSVSAGGGSANCPNVVVGASLYGMAVPSITAVPERVVPNGTSVLRVSATGVDSGCTLTGPGVTRDLTPVNGVVAVTNVTTAPITNQSTYVLSCDDGEATAKAIVNIIPSIQEF
jgi:hypothetical protein